MTEKKAQILKSSLPSGWSAGRLCFGFFSLFCLLLILRNPNVAIEYMNRGLRICAKTVIPSLFPFMVISEVILSSGIGALLIRPVSPIFKKLFRLSETGACAVLLGMLCGFPVGAKCTALALDEGRIDREEAERVLSFSNNPSSAFLISAVGVSLWENERIGQALLLTVLLAQLLTGLLLAHLPRKANGTATPVAPPSAMPRKPLLHEISCFTDAVKSAAFGMLTVCAYVIFFSALSGTVTLLLERFPLPSAVKAAMFCTLELSGGMSAASAIPNVKTALLLSAFCAGWSGLSVHCQILSVIDGRGLCLRPYFLSKLLQGGFCVGIFSILLKLCPMLLQGGTDEAVGVSVMSAFPLPLFTVLYLLALLPLLLGIHKRKSTPR